MMLLMEAHYTTNDENCLIYIRLILLEMYYK